MFSSPFCAPLVTLVAYAFAISAAPAVPIALSSIVQTSNPNVNVDGSENLSVTATVANTGDETLEPLNDPHRISNPFPENYFTITDPSDPRPSFRGALVNYNPTHAAGLDHPKAFTVLAPSEPTSAARDLSDAYKLAQLGAGGYSIEPSDPVDTEGTPKVSYATVEATAEAKPSGHLAVSRRSHYRRTTYNGCSVTQQARIKAAAKAAQKAAAEAYTYIKKLNIKKIKRPKPRYTTWFGPYDAIRKAKIQSVFKGVSKGITYRKFTYDCSCGNDTLNAYVFPNRFGKMWICPGFWFEDDIGRQKAVLIHEATHFLGEGGTQDFAYGRFASEYLADTDPDIAALNADNYMYFAHNREKLK